MKTSTKILSAFILLAPAMLFAANVVYRPVTVTPPEPPRELRAAWIVTLNVADVDWPSSPGLSVAQQKSELVALLDQAVALKLNAVFLQIRPASDALYASTIEPWSEYLTGMQGKPPVPFYDPLSFAITEAHKRGLELHAWINPFRARHGNAKSFVSPYHISRTHPEYIHQYGSQLWLDPGIPAVRSYVLSVIMDVVQRYDVDGIVFDDYFYPYPEKDEAGRSLNFQDNATWRKYGGRLGLDEWRRQNIDIFIQSVYQNIKSVKPWVKFGVGPFGIWRPGYPPSVRGLDAYGSLYADSRLWLANGWVDYLSPQLYWPVSAPQQGFAGLLNWWAAQNTDGRILCPSLNAAEAGKKFPADEIDRQITITRRQPGAGGEVFYHLKSITANPTLSEMVRTQYASTALMPTTPWVADTPQAKPQLVVTENNRTVVSLAWGSGTGETARLWVFQYETNEVWTTKILPGGTTSWTFDNIKPDIISISAVDRAGNMSEAASLKKYARPVSGKAPANLYP